MVPSSSGGGVKYVVTDGGEDLNQSRAMKPNFPVGN